MMKTLNTTELRKSIWNWLVLPGHDKPMLVVSQYGCHTFETVYDVVSTYASTKEKVKIVSNDNEDVDVCAFVEETAASCDAKWRMICVTVAPWDSTMDYFSGFSERMDIVRHQVDINDWIATDFKNIQPPVAAFLKRNPKFLITPFGEKPHPNTSGPTPDAWLEISEQWGRQYPLLSRNNKLLTPKEKCRKMMLEVGAVMGVVHPLFEKLERYIMFHHSYNDVAPRSVPFYDEPEYQSQNEAKFTDVFRTNHEE